VIKRKTAETDISLTLNIDGKGASDVNTGIGFLNHMLSLLAKHGLFDLKIRAKGDLDVDTHHTNEDVGICLGEAVNKALGDRKGIRRFSQSYVPMEDDLVRVVVDISGRPKLRIESRRPYSLRSEDVTYSLEDAKQFLQAFVNRSKITLHISLLNATDLHHSLEALFKALARALDEATQIDKRIKGIPTTKGRL
jgi:imidazoleglycerol-phosphate dehydratase